jgi:hypothetical protein
VALPDPAVLAPPLAVLAVAVPVALAPPLAVLAVPVPPEFGVGTRAWPEEEPAETGFPVLAGFPTSDGLPMWAGLPGVAGFPASEPAALAPAAPPGAVVAIKVGLPGWATPLQ